MKRVWIAVLLLAVLIGGCFWTYHTIAQLSHSIVSVAENAEHAAEKQDIASAQVVFLRAEAMWKQHQALFGALVRHNELDEVAALFARAGRALEQGDVKEYLQESAELCEMLRHIPEMDAPTIENIF